MKKSENTEQKNRKIINLLPLTIIAFLVIIWQLAIVIGKIPHYILPAPIMVIKALYSERGLLASHAFVTLIEALLGYGISIVMGFAFGLAMGYFETLRKALYPLFVISQTIPLIILAPLFAIWFGFGLIPKILIVVLVCFFPISVTFAQALIKRDESMESLLKVMGATRWRSFLLERVPKSIPALFSGLKISATYSIMGAVISEWIGAQKGLGILMTRSMTSFRTSILFADVLVIIILSLGLYKLVEIIENKLVSKMEYI